MFKKRTYLWFFLIVTSLFSIIATLVYQFQLFTIQKSKTAGMVFNIKEEKSYTLEPQIQSLYKWIAELQEMERIIISLELEDVKQAEIANIVGLSEPNTRVKIHRIKEKLTQKFKENGQ